MKRREESGLNLSSGRRPKNIAAKKSVGCEMQQRDITIVRDRRINLKSGTLAFTFHLRSIPLPLPLFGCLPGSLFLPFFFLCHHTHLSASTSHLVSLSLSPAHSFASLRFSRSARALSVLSTLFVCISPTQFSFVLVAPRDLQQSEAHARI